MKKMLAVLLCMMCMFVVGCQKKEEIINSGNTSGELEINESNKGSESGEGILITPANKDEFVGEKKYSHSDFVVYFFPDSGSKQIEKDELMSLDLDQLEKAKNEIFARHGHDFSSEYLKKYFSEKDWYKPVSGKNVTVSELNKIEQINVNLIDNVIKEKKDFYTKENIIEYAELMYILGRTRIVEINFIDSNAEKFDKKYDKKAYTTFNCQDKIEVYFLNTDLGNKVYFVSNGPIELLNGKYMFSSFSKCKRINGIELLDTSKATNMFGMFSECEELEELDLKKFNTSNVTNMGCMFSNCKSLLVLDVSNFDTKNVTFMASMFNCCENLTTLDLTSFDTSKVENMAWMFMYCRRLTKLDVSSFDTSNVENMSRMFSLCYELVNLDVSEFNTAKCISMWEMFSGCSKVRNLELSNFDTRNVGNMSRMFKNCSALTSLNLDNFNTRKVTSMNEMFFGCKNLEWLYISNFDTSSVTTLNDMFKECYALNTSSSYNLDKEIISYYDLSYMNGYKLQLAKNEIYARNGCEFDDKLLAQYFMSQDWYKPIQGKKAVFSELSKIERINVELIDAKIINPRLRFGEYYYDEEKGKVVFLNSFAEPIKILKEIRNSDVDKKYDFDWDTQKNEYPLAQKYLLNDTYENKKLGVSKLEVYFCGFRYDDYVDRIFEINVNGVKKEVISDGPIYVIDIDENDSYLEIATDDAWENGCYTSITRFINNKFVDMGSMNDAIGGLEDYRCFNGKIYDWFSLNFEEEIIIPKYFVIENDKIVMKIVKYEGVKDKVYTVTEDVLHTFKCEDKLKVGDKIKILNIYDNSDEITFECQGMVLRVMNEKGEIFEIGYAGSWAT